MFRRLAPPDVRICPICSGIGWYYVQTPDHNFPLEAVLRQCQRQHADKVLVVDDIETPLFERQPTQEATRT